VEGFANFFGAYAMRYQNPSLQYWPNATWESHYNVGQGLLIEYNFAALLWDMYDDETTPDGLVADETMEMTPAQIANIIIACRFPALVPTYLMSHTYQFVYCAEGIADQARSAAPSNFQNDWFAVGQVSWDATPPTLPNFSSFRSSWLRNFYGL